MDGHQQTIMPAPARGFTLVEAVVSTALIAVVVVAFTGLLTQENQVLQEEVVETTTETQIRKTMENAVAELQDSRYYKLTFNGAPRTDYGDSFSYQIPKTDVNGRLVLDANGKMQFGIGDPGSFVVGGFGTISFRPGTRPEDTISEAALGVDLNGNGNATDTFLVGTLELTRSNDPQYIRELGTAVVDSTGGKIFTKIGEDFVDSNHNGIYDSYESYNDANGNGKFDIGLIMQIMYIDVQRLSVSRVRVAESAIKLRNSE